MPVQKFPKIDNWPLRAGHYKHLLMRHLPAEDDEDAIAEYVIEAGRSHPGLVHVSARYGITTD